MAASARCTGSSSCHVAAHHSDAAWPVAHTVLAPTRQVRCRSLQQPRLAQHHLATSAASRCRLTSSRRCPPFRRPTAQTAASLRTSYTAELPAELPATLSCSHGLEGLTETQQAVQAVDWGYTQLGAPFPEGVSMQALSRRVPDSLLQPDPKLAWGYLLLSLGIMAAGAAWLWYWHSICPLWQRTVCWVLLGTGYFGVFQTACDCARFAFQATSQRSADLLGSLLMAPSLFSYETWRLKWFNHIQNVNMLDEDSDAWQPLTLQQLAQLPQWKQKLLHLINATPLRFLSSIGLWAAHFEYFDLKFHPKLTRPFVLVGWAVPVLFAALAWPALLVAGGGGAWVDGWLMPWVVFHGWLSLTTLVHHTAPHIPWVEQGLQYDHGQATINGTVTMQLPSWLEAVLHHANYDLPKHVTVGVPSYRCKEVFAHLQQRLGPYLTTATFNMTLVLNLMTAWLVYDPTSRQYMDFDAALERVDAAAGSNSSSSSGSGATSSSSSHSRPESSTGSSSGAGISAEQLRLQQQQQQQASSNANGWQAGAPRQQQEAPLGQPGAAPA